MNSDFMPEQEAPGGLGFHVFEPWSGFPRAGGISRASTWEFPVLVNNRAGFDKRVFGAILSGNSTPEEACESLSVFHSVPLNEVKESFSEMLALGAVRMEGEDYVPVHETFKQPLIFCPTDISRFLDSPVNFGSSDNAVYNVICGCGKKCKRISDCPRRVQYSVGDMLTDFLEFIQSTPHVNWIIQATNLAELHRFWPTHSETGSPVRLDNVAVVGLVTWQSELERIIDQKKSIDGLCDVFGIGIIPINENIQFGDNLDLVDWVYVSGGIGADANPCDVDGIRSIIKECDESNVPVMVMGLGSEPINGDGSPLEDIVDPTGRDRSEWPSDLVRLGLPEF